MEFIRSLLVLVFIGLVAANDDWNATGDASGPRPLRDRFRLIQSNVIEQRVNEEIEDFTAYGCEKMIVIRNHAQEDFRLWCRSLHDAPKMAVINPGNAFTFTFRPRKNGESVFWCTLEYRHQIARFDVYNEQLPHMCPRDIHEVHQYTVNHDGIYVDPAKGNEGIKIRALFKGHNKYILWEEFENNATDGFLMSGLVDGGMCADVPEQFNDKTEAVTVCYNHCVHLYEHYGCRGLIQTVQASDDCVDVGVEGNLKGKISAVKGC